MRIVPRNFTRTLPAKHAPIAYAGGATIPTKVKPAYCTLPYKALPPNMTRRYGWAAHMAYAPPAGAFVMAYETIV